MRKFEVINKIPEKISFIKWDVDGTVTDRDVIPQKILDLIIEFSLKDIISFFITGRDAFWMERFFIKPLKKKIGRNLLIKSKVAENVFLRPELEMIEINDPMTGKKEILAEIKNHPFLKAQKRKKVAKLFFDTRKLQPYKNGAMPNGFEAGKDAENNVFLFPTKTEIPFPDFFWSKHKLAMGTTELRREMNGSCLSDRAKKIIPQVKKLKKF